MASHCLPRAYTPVRSCCINAFWLATLLLTCACSIPDSLPIPSPTAPQSPTPPPSHLHPRPVCCSCWKNAFWFVTLLYPRCAMTALQLFGWQKLDIGTFLKADFSVMVS